jgi:hypothetical protein
LGLCAIEEEEEEERIKKNKKKGRKSVHSSEASVFIKGEKFLASPSYWQLLKKTTRPRCLMVVYIR